jgi:hypothetical protein
MKISLQTPIRPSSTIPFEIRRKTIDLDGSSAKNFKIAE